MVIPHIRTSLKNNLLHLPIPNKFLLLALRQIWKKTQIISKRLAAKFIKI